MRGQNPLPAGHNLILCGFMGCGKTTLGQLLADKLDMAFVDMDDVIVARAGIPVPQIFARQGESGFRELEYAAAVELSRRQHMVLATGGGALTFARNAEALRQGGVVVYLNPGFDRCYKRIARSDRPLVRQHTKEELDALYQTRQEQYRLAAHLEVSLSGSPQDSVDQILLALASWAQSIPRDMNPGDEEEILALWLESTVQGHPFLSRAYWEESAAAVRNQYLPAAHTRVLRRNGIIAGFISILEEEFIGALFVHPDWQGTGAGKALLEDAKARHPRLSLAVYQDNQRAVDFYQRQGFSVLETRPNGGTGLPEHLMIWHREENSQ